MEDIKYKFLEFINKQGSAEKIPIVGASNVDLYEKDDELELEDIRQHQSEDEKDTQSDREILESIHPDYFQGDDFDPCLYELKKLPPVLNCEEISQDLMTLKKQQLVVSKQVLQLILEKQAACQDEINRIVEIQKLIDETLDIVRSGRKDLDIARHHFTTASLGIVANYRKRTVVLEVLRSINNIKTLLRTETRLQELLSAGDYAGAISLLHECQSAAVTYRHFTCIQALSAKLQDTLVMAEEQLDKTLDQICYKFDETVYSKLQAAYALLGKTRTAVDQLHMYFISAVNNSAFNVVHNYAQDSTKKEYKELCKCVKEEDFIECLVVLCKAIWGIVHSYHRVVSWHQNHTSVQTPSADGGDFESNLHEQYVRHKLESGLNRLWQDVQARVSTLLVAVPLTHYKFDEFLHVLAIVHRLEQIGEEFCSSASSKLQDSMRTQSTNYFRRYHISRLEELRIFLENEVWTPCPVRSDFSLLHLQEFKGLRNSLQQCAGVGGGPRVSSRSSGGSLDGSSGGGSYFTRFATSGTPFDSCQDVGSLGNDEDILADIIDDPSGYYSEESEDENPELRGEDANNSSHNKQRRKHDGSCPLLTNTTLTVLRHCGKYLQMSRLLRSNTTDVIACLSQLFEYYLYAVYSFFAADLPVISTLNVTSIKLQAVIKRIKETLIQSNSDMESLGDKVPEPMIPRVVELSDVETLHGLSERIVAVESLVFLAEQFTFLKPYLESLHSQSHNLHQLYTQTVSVATDVRKPVYACVAWRAVDVSQILAHMSRVNWEVKDIMSQHSQYVDIILRELQIFSMRLEEVGHQVTIPQAVHDALWENIAYLLAYIFVEGFSSAKRCSHEGRGLMQLDFTQLVSQLEKMCSLRPVPYREYVEAFVKAYYHTEPALEAFVKDHNEYSAKQLLALVSCACQNNKKTRQRLCNLIEELDRTGAR